MARHTPNDSQPQDAFDDLEELAERVGVDYDITKKRLTACLLKLTGAFRVDKSIVGDSTHRAVRLIHGAISALGEQEGIQYLENVDLLQMAQRIRAVECMRSELVPFCSLDELQNQLQNFLKYQDEIEGFLIQTGLPPQKYDESPWLYLQLGRLYDTRRTSSPYPRKQSLPTFRNGHGPLDAEPEQISSSSLPLREPYDWVTYPTGAGISPGEIETCEYEDADFLSGLTPEDANQLEAERPRILAARRAVVSEIIRACELREGEGLLDRCLEILTTQLTPDDILFLLRMDSFYLGGDSRTLEQVEVTPKMSPGGLTNLIEVISHVEDELMTGRIDRLLCSIPGVEIDLLSDEDASTAYLKLIHEADADVINKALDKYSERVKVTRRHRQEVCRRFITWIDPDFQVPINSEVQPELSEQESLLDGRITWLTEQVIPLLQKLNTQLESQNKVGKDFSSSNQSCTPNKFHYDGVSWIINFEGEMIACSHLNGLFYIAEILKSPDKGISATELYTLITGWETTGSTALRENIDRIDYGMDNSSADVVDIINHFKDRTVSLKDLAKLRDLCKVLEQKIAAAREDGQGDKSVELQSDLDFLQKFIDTNTNKQGQPALLQSKPKNATDTVRNSINRALDKLKRLHKPLHEHLDKSIKTKPTWRYAPTTKVDWEF